MKIVFMGTPLAAAKSLDRLIADDHQVVAVYTQPDRPAGRGKKISQSPVKQLALEHDLPVFQPTKLRTEEAVVTFRSNNADMAVVVAYGRILPEGFLHAFPFGAVNVHFSLLPKYRGAAPVNWAIVNGETETGVTIMKMDAGLDTGDILLQRSTPVGEDETAVELMQRLGNLGAEVLSESLSLIDTLIPQSQNHQKASYAPILTKDDGLLDWTMTAGAISNRVRGFQPFPTSYTFLDGSRITIWKAAPTKVQTTQHPPGMVLEALGDVMTIACGAGTRLSITEIQPEGKRRMATRDFLNGSKLTAGKILGKPQ